MEDYSGELISWLRKSGAEPGAIAIIRPDKITYALVTADELPRTVRGLADQLGLSAAGAGAIPGDGIGNIIPAGRSAAAASVSARYS